MADDARIIARGKPAEYGQEIVKRRFRLTAARSNFAGKTVLDFGCGNGAQTIEFLATGCKIVAIDIDLADLSLMKEYLRTTRSDTIVPVRYDGHSIPIPSASIDIAVSFEVIEHVPDESQALREIYRVLKPGGDFILSVPNKAWVFETHGAELPLLPWNRVPFFSWLPKPIHRRFAKARIYRRREVIHLLTRHAFEVKEAVYITAPMDVVKAPWLKAFLRSTFFSGDTTSNPFLSTSILIHCRKN